MFGVENRTTVPIEVVFSVGRSENFVYSGTSHVAKRLIQPNRVEYLMNIRREFTEEEMLLDYDFKFTLKQ
jgi:hypothetical protein